MAGGLSRPKMPDTSAAEKAQSEALEKQTEMLNQQEARLDAQEKSAQATAAASARSRRRGRGAFRLLLSSARGGSAATGIKGSGTTLGG